MCSLVTRTIALLIGPPAAAVGEGTRALLYCADVMIRF
jgi:hypothetical protein